MKPAINYAIFNPSKVRIHHQGLFLNMIRRIFSMAIHDLIGNLVILDMIFYFLTKYLEFTVKVSFLLEAVFKKITNCLNKYSLCLLTILA